MVMEVGGACFGVVFLILTKKNGAADDFTSSTLNSRHACTLVSSLNSHNSSSK